LGKAGVGADDGERGIARRRYVDAGGGAVEGFESRELGAPQNVAQVLVEIAVAQAFDSRYAAGARTTRT
jgi:hypothetical protein